MLQDRDQQRVLFAKKQSVHSTWLQSAKDVLILKNDATSLFMLRCASAPAVGGSTHLFYWIYSQVRLRLHLIIRYVRHRLRNVRHFRFVTLSFLLN